MTVIRRVFRAGNFWECLTLVLVAAVVMAHGIAVLLGVWP